MTDPPPSQDELDLEVRVAAAIAGPLLAVAVAGGLVGARDDLGVTNVGFVMVLVVLAVGVVGGRLAGILTAASAALAFNYFHTQPYLSLGVAARQDVISIVLLAVVGGTVGEIGHRAASRARRVAHLTSEQHDVDVVLTAIALGATVEETWTDLRAMLAQYGRAERSTFVALGHADGHDPGKDATPASEVARMFVLPVSTRQGTVGHLHVVLATARMDRTAGGWAMRAAAILGIALTVAPDIPGQLD